MSGGKLILKILKVSAIKIFRGTGKKEASKLSKYNNKIKIPIVVDTK